MTQHFSSTFQRQITVIHPGEYGATKDDAVFSTVLGSCIAVVLYDPIIKCGGMNHFLLPIKKDTKDLLASEAGRYGMYAMDLLINSMMKLGAQRHTLVAKVFGGASTIAGATGATTNVPQSNIEFAMNYLQIEGIPIVASDVGGTRARKIFLFTRSANVKLKRIDGTSVLQVIKSERRYLKSVKEEASKGHDAVLF